MREEEVEASILRDFDSLLEKLNECEENLRSRLKYLLIEKLHPSIQSTEKIEANKTGKNSLNRERKIYECEECENFECYSRYTLRRHQSSNCKKPSYKCGECRKIFRSQISFHVHQRIHEKSNILECELCEFKTDNPKNLKNHLRQGHVENGPYQCKICDKEIFGGRAVFRNHLKLHTQDKGFLCWVCDKGFINQGRLNSHMSAVHERKNYQCEVCSSFFGTKFSLERHSITHKKINEVEKYACIFCPYKTPLLSNLTKHVQDVHKKASFQAGKWLKSVKKMVTPSTEETYIEIMEKKSQDITESYLREYSQKINRETSVEDLKIDSEEMDRVVAALLSER